MSFLTSRQHPDLHPSRAVKLSGVIFCTCGVEVDGLLKKVTTLPGKQSFTSLWGIPPGEGFVWFVDNLHELTQTHLLGLLQGAWKAPAPREPGILQAQATNSFHLGCHALKKICGNSTCPSCFTVSIKGSILRKWSQLVKEEVVMLPSLPFATYLCQQFNYPVKLQETVIPIFWPF